jgi:hypothetical protein
MKKSFIFSFLLLSSNAYSKSLLDYVLHPNRLAPDAQSCALEDDDDLKTQCVEALCKGLNPDLYPMILEDDKFESFINSHPNKVTEETLKKNESYFDYQVRSISKAIDAMAAKPVEDLIKEFSKTDKQTMVTSYFTSKCSQTISPEKPLAERLSVTCDDPDLDKNPLKTKIGLAQAVGYQQNISDALIMGYYSEKEVAALVPGQEQLLKTEYEAFKATNPEGDQSKKLIEFMDKSWGKYATLDYAGRMRFLKGLNEIRLKKDVESSYQTNLCFAPECETMFDEMVRKDDVQKKLMKIKTALTSAEFRKTALASMKVQSALKANAPTEEDISAFNGHKEKVIDALLEYQEKTMSEHSFSVYKEKLASAVVSLDDSIMESSVYETGETEASWSNDSILQLAYQGPEYLYSYVGASQGAPMALISDYYNDPKYKDFYEDGFDEVEVKYSLFSLKEKEYGAMIFAHELGHHFSHLHTAGEFSPKTAAYVDQAKSCIKNRYEKFQAATGKDAGNHYLEEEFADEFGFTVNDENSKMLFCPLLVTPYSTEGHLSLDIMGSADNHPQDLWRSLNQLKASGREIPLSCKELMLKNAESYEYKRCL